jgi:catechol 2,3-dioxygenase-like lactoylglutathione lyase family enzyme
MAQFEPERAINAGADVGRVDLTVTDLDRAVAFYRDVIGLHVTQRDASSRPAGTTTTSRSRRGTQTRRRRRHTPPACITSPCGCPTRRRWQRSSSAATLARCSSPPAPGC